MGSNTSSAQFNLFNLEWSRGFRGECVEQDNEEMLRMDEGGGERHGYMQHDSLTYPRGLDLRTRHLAYSLAQVSCFSVRSYPLFQSEASQKLSLSLTNLCLCFVLSSISPNKEKNLLHCYACRPCADEFLPRAF